MKTLFDVNEYFNLIPPKPVLKRGNPNFIRKYTDETKVIRVPKYLVDAIKDFIQDKEDQKTLPIDPPQITEINNFVTQIKKDDYEIAVVDPTTISIDPRRFQFKQIHNIKTGSSGSLSGVKKWDAVFAGLIQVWLDPSNNKTYVVNGHNRLNLALQLGVKSIAIQYLNCDNAIEARIKGALHNMIDGKGTLLDAAKILKETNLTGNDLKNIGISLKDSFLQKSLNISNLENWLFEKTMLGELDEKTAAAIGSLPKQDQKTMYDMIKSYKGNISEKALLEIKTQIELSSSQSSMSLDLFGNKEDTVNTAIQRSKVCSWIETQLRRSARIFGLVSNTKNHDLLDEVAENIDTVTSCLKSDQAKQILDIFLIEKSLSGDISDRINDCVTKELNNENINQVREELMSWLIVYIGNKHNFLHQLMM